MGLDDRWEEMKKDKTRVAVIGRRLDKIRGEISRLEEERDALLNKWESKDE